MYNKFYGFKEKPFLLVPNPDYLFLSKSHEEILAHLSYAISQGDGFVEITGEVGTGKTTLCRAFLEGLDKTIEAAYIFNPKLDALQLLKAINDEFGIDSSPDNTKDLIDILNAFLITKKAAGQKILVLIDEAQNLSLEVLEQLRLLSNLETTQKKLLQIILVGQPELGEILATHQLRQLGQRITINCRLAPLTFQETRDYIRHRISLASHRAGPHFDKASFRAIYKFSRGIPRLINIACDRVLLNGFTRNSFNITASITKEALKELTHEKSGSSTQWLQGRTGIIVLTAVLALLAIVLLSVFKGQPLKTSVADKVFSAPRTLFLQGKNFFLKNKKVFSSSETISPNAPQSGIQPEASILPDQLSEASAVDKDNDVPITDGKELLGNTEKPLIKPAVRIDEQDFLSFLTEINPRNSRSSALKETIKLWFPEQDVLVTQREINADPLFFQETTMFYDLQILHLATDADLDIIQTINLPVIFTFYLKDVPWPKYLAAVYADQDNLYFADAEGDRILMVDKDSILKYWSGEVYVVWKNFNNLQGLILPESRSDNVKILKNILQQLGYRQLETTDFYDKQSVEVIKHLQKKNGVQIDGKIGPITKIILYNESRSFAKPSLAVLEGAGKEYTN
jgi:general secretion pathway protein A